MVISYFPLPLPDPLVPLPEPLPLPDPLVPVPELVPLPRPHRTAS